MNFIVPKELKSFLEDYKKIHKKILSSCLNITDLNFNGHTNSVFEIDFSRININETFSFLIVITDLFITFQEESGIFTISILTKDKNAQVLDHGKIYTGMFDNKRYRNLRPITTCLNLNKPVTILLKIDSIKPVYSVFNVGVTINQ
jgi:hypothetical protein